MLKYDNINDFIEINWVGIKVIIAVPCNVSRPDIVAGAAAGILEYYCLRTGK